MKKFLHNQEISQKIITERLLFARSSKVFRSRIRIKLMIKASTTVTIFYEKKKKSDPSFRKSRRGEGRQKSFLPFDVFLHVSTSRGSPRDSFKGITPLAFPRQPRRRDWHSRRVLDPLADRRDTSTPRHLDSQHSSRETVDNGWPQRYILIRSLRNIFFQSLETIHFLPLLFF